MFKPFSWMFTTENFKEQVKYLFFIFIKFYLAAIILLLFSEYLLSNSIWTVVLPSIAIILFIIPFLCAQGYFWNVTANIISREWDITSATVFNGKIKEVFKVELPELNTKKFIWRGIASCVATTMMVLPFGLILAGSAWATSLSNLPPQTIIVLYVFILMFIPALLWNYAVRDSIFAVWNIRKAIQIMGNYTGKYIWNTLLYVLFYVVTSVLLSLIATALGIRDIATQVSMLNIIKLLVYLTISYLQYLYSLYVYAYLLGTIAPPSEG